MKKILLVDDVALLIEMQKRFLASSVVHILTARDGVEALEMARKERPDLIVMDKYMPRMDGVSCCIAIKADPNLKQIPVIMVSNAVTPADIQEYERAGSRAYLSKPLDAKQFLDTVKKFLPGIERRSHRVPLKTDVNLTLGSSTYVGFTEDLAMNGIYVASNLQVMQGEELEVSFMLPGSDAPLEAHGRVAWVNRDGTSGLRTGFGVEFIKITGKGIPFLRTEELKTFIAKHASG